MLTVYLYNYIINRSVLLSAIQVRVNWGRQMNGFLSGYYILHNPKLSPNLSVTPVPLCFVQITFVLLKLWSWVWKPNESYPPPFTNRNHILECTEFGVFCWVLCAFTRYCEAKHTKMGLESGGIHLGKLRKESVVVPIQHPSTYEYRRLYCIQKFSLLVSLGPWSWWCIKKYQQILKKYLKDTPIWSLWRLY